MIALLHSAKKYDNTVVSWERRRRREKGCFKVEFSRESTTKDRLNLDVT